MKRTSRMLATVGPLLLGCSSPGPTWVRIPFSAEAAPLPPDILLPGGGTLHIESAQLAFGPFYLCASKTAGELCETARFEWLDAQVLDLTSSDVRSLGELTGTTGQVESYMFDLGITSSLTAVGAHPLPAADDLGGASLLVNGQLEGPGYRLPITIDLPLTATTASVRGVPVIQSQTSESFGHEVTAGDSLQIRFHPELWFASLTAEDLLESMAPSCVAPETCESPLTVEPDSVAGEQLIQALTTGTRPEFMWENKQ